jgi:hypothetical protein
MTTSSTLYEVRSARSDPTQYLVGTQADGTLVYHGRPGTPVPAEATRVIRDGSAAWTWAEIAAEQSADWCAHVTPHQWDSEDTNKELNVADWPLLTPPLSDAGTPL